VAVPSKWLKNAMLRRQRLPQPRGDQMRCMILLVLGLVVFAGPGSAKEKAKELPGD
jgi:hypothetical protein